MWQKSRQLYYGVIAWKPANTLQQVDRASNLKWCRFFKIQDGRPTVKTMRTWLSYAVKQMVSGIFLTSNEQFYEISYL